MRVKKYLPTNVIMPVELDECEAFLILCEALDMEFVCDDERDFYVIHDHRTGENVVWMADKSGSRLYDDRGDLFLALRSVASIIFPGFPSPRMATDLDKVGGADG